MFADGDNEIVLKVLHSQDIISVIVGWFWSFYCDKNVVCVVVMLFENDLFSFNNKSKLSDERPI